MEFQDVVDRRRMIRDYDARPVDPAIVDRALRNATHAPSAGFSQGWGFLLLDTPADVQRWWRTTTETVAEPDAWLAGMMRAPVIIVPCASKAAYVRRYAEADKAASPRTSQAEVPWPVPYWQLDAAMASLLILQTAVDEGLGACFFGIPTARTAAVRSEFAIAAEFDPIGVITLGHRAPSTRTTGSPRTRRRRPVAEVVHRGTWGSAG